ncbi:MAG: hypothetical protein HOW73_43250 [Polyangiaceae bacterium]|nr:hypothetical protein [Polyangiaceae bacterium]
MKFQGRAVDLTKAELRALVAHASADTSRPHHNAVWFVFARSEAVAVDSGRMLIAAGESPDVPTDYHAPTFGVPRKTLASLARRLRSADLVRLEMSPPRATVLALGLNVRETLDLEDAHFAGGSLGAPPPYEIPLHRAGAAGMPDCAFVWAISARYLGDVALVEEALYTSSCTILAPQDDDEPTVVRVYPCLDMAASQTTRTNDPPWTIVIMPVTGRGRAEIDEAEDARADRNAAHRKLAEANAEIARLRSIPPPPPPTRPRRRKSAPSAPTPSNVVPIRRPA